MNAVTRLAQGLMQPLLALAERRLPALTRLRSPEALPIRLHRRRIYVLPTMFGISLAVLLVIMQLGALNYANNPALLLTCMLAGAACMSLFAGFSAFSGLELVAVAAPECHAGERCELALEFKAGARARAHLRLRLGNDDTVFALARDEVRRVGLPIQPSRRGWFRPGRIKLWTDQPLGLFVIWSWIHPDVGVLVYPRAEASAPPLPRGAQGSGPLPAAGDGEEFAGLRDYRRGDPQRQIAWKASARHESLLVRESESSRAPTVTLRIADLGQLDFEQRIARLTAWVLAAEAAQTPYRLDLGHESFGPALGDGHRRACLKALALLPDAT